MTTDVAIDSNILIGSLLENDSRHGHAISLLHEIKNRRKIFNQFLFAEFCTLILMRSKSIAYTASVTKEFLSNTMLPSEYLNVPISKSLTQNTYAIFCSQGSPNVSFQDCSIIALARLRKIRTIATFDKNLRREFSGEFEFLPKESR